MWNWNERPTKAEPKHSTGGDTPATVYAIGKYEVTVAGDEREVSYRVPSHYRGDPRASLPNMEIVDGEIRIPMTDFVEEMLSRVPAVELASTLWDNKEVRDAFLDVAVDRWGSCFTDDERRRFLRDVKETIHSKALDKLASTMATLEYDSAKRSFHYHQVNSANESLGNLEERLRCKFGDPEITLPRFQHHDHDLDFKISGTHWNEARDGWRKEVIQRFPFEADPAQANGDQNNA